MLFILGRGFMLTFSIFCRCESRQGKDHINRKSGSNWNEKCAIKTPYPYTLENENTNSSSSQGGWSSSPEQH
jgi:hypothetical protein